MGEQQIVPIGPLPGGDMKRILIACLLAGPPTLAFADGAKVTSQPDMVKFTYNADICEHLAGEWAPENTKAENRVIERNLNKHCGLAKRLQINLLKKCKGDAGATATLNQYEAVNYFRPRP